MTKRSVRLLKEMTPQIITSCCEPMWLAIVPPPYSSKRLKTRLRLSSGHSWIRDSLGDRRRDCTFSASTFIVDRSWHHCNWSRRCTDVIRKHLRGRWEHKVHSFRHVLRFIFDTCVPATLWIIDDDEFDTVTFALTVAVSSRFTLAIGRPLPFYPDICCCLYTLASII